MLHCNDQAFFDEMSEYIEDQILQMSLYYQVSILSVYCHRGLDNPLFLAKVINGISRNSADLNLTLYAQLWTLTAKLSLHFPKQENLPDGEIESATSVALQMMQGSLMKLVPRSKFIKPSRFNLDELNQIILSLAGLRVKDFSFVENFLQAGAIILKNKPERISNNQEIIDFVKACYGYSNSLEQFFIICHTYCEVNFSQFTPEELLVLKKIFNLRTDIIKQSSPFFKL